MCDNMKKNRRQLDLDLPRSPRKQKVFTTPSSWIQKWWLTKFKKNKKENPPLCNANAPIPFEKVSMLSLIRMIGNGRFFNSWDYLIPLCNLTTHSNPFLSHEQTNLEKVLSNSAEIRLPPNKRDWAESSFFRHSSSDLKKSKFQLRF